MNDLNHQAPNRRRTVSGEVVDVFVLATRHWRLFLVVGVVCAAASLAYFASLPPRYTADVSILPRGGGGAGLLGRIAGLGGGVLPESDENLEAVYEEIIFSDTVLGAVAGRRWSVGAGDEPVPLWTALDIDVPATADSVGRVTATKRVLRSDVVSFHRDFETGYMVLEVTVAEHPRLAADLANAIVDELNRFNIDFRTRKSADKQAFIEARLADIEGDLNAATGAVTDFLTRNRDYASSPILLQQYSELEREVQALKSIWIEMKRQLELVKIETNRQTIAVDVLDRASVPQGRSGPHAIYYAAFGLFFGILVAVAILAMRGLVHRMRAAVMTSDVGRPADG